MGKYDYDVLVVGAGPGGYVAAIRASQLGLKAGIVEKNKPGGVCLNIGCIPSKSLIHQAEIFHGIRDLESMGVKVDKKGFDYARVFKKTRRAADTLSRGVEFLLKKNEIDLIKGTAVLVGPHEVKVDGEKTVTGENIILATGSRPRPVPGFDFEDERILSSDDALMLERLPKSAVILGGGFIGVEFAYIMNAFGVEIHIVELLDRLLPVKDPDMCAMLERSFKKQSVKVYTSTKAVGYKSRDKGISLTVLPEGGQEKQIDADMILVMVGRTPNTEGIGLEKLGIETEKGFVKVGDYYQTKEPSVYAIGDIVSTPQLAHVASKEGEIVAEHIAGRDTEPRVDPLKVPSTVYSEPQVASFGYNEYQLKERGVVYQKAVFPYRGAGKSVAIEKSEGVVKVLCDPETCEILGAHIFGHDAAELIHEILLAYTAELLPGDIASMIHSHPTLSEAVMEAMRVAEGWAIHV